MMWVKFIIAFVFAALIDQGVKQLFLGGARYDGEFFSFVLVFNDGVAFSMLSGLKEWLKYLQIALIAAIIVYLIYEKKLMREYNVALGVLLGSGSSNILDRFIHGGVVDYVFWHKWFEFAVFNLADVLIDFSVAYILISSLKRRKNG